MLTSFIPACGKCKWCARGLQNLCDSGARILIGDQPGGGFRAHADGTLDDINQAYADMRAGVNIRGVIDFISAGS